MDAETRAALEWAYDYAATMTLAADHPTDKKLFSSYARTLQGLLDGEKGGALNGERSESSGRIATDAKAEAGSTPGAPPDAKPSLAERIEVLAACDENVPLDADLRAIAAELREIAEEMATDECVNVSAYVERQRQRAARLAGKEGT